MGCSSSKDAAEPNSSKNNKISGTPSDFKPLSKTDQTRIDMVLDYWYDETEWSEDKHRYYLSLLEQVAEQRNTDQSIKETAIESFDNKSTPKGPNRTR